MRITFNVAMTCEGIFLTRPPLMKPCSGVSTQDFVLSYDRRTLRMACEVAKNTQYGVRMNHDPAYDLSQAPVFDQLDPVALPHVTFLSLAGSPLKPFELTFSTSSGPEITTLQDALTEDSQAPAQVETSEN